MPPDEVGTDLALPYTVRTPRLRLLTEIIDGNEVHHLKTGSIESLVVNGNVTNFRITHNIVHDNNNIGIDVIGFERTATDSVSCGIHLGLGHRRKTDSGSAAARPR